MGVDALGCAFGPWVFLGVLLTDHKAIKQGLAVFGIINNAFLNMFQANAFDPRCGAFQITGLFAVKLDEGTAIFLDLFIGCDLAQKFGRADMDAAIAPNMQIPAAIGCHHAEILDGGFGTVARTGRNDTIPVRRMF